MTRYGRDQWIRSVLPHGIDAEGLFDVSAAVNVAVAIHESDFGQSRLAVRWNNHHGIKAVAQQRRCPDGIHRHFDFPAESYRSCAYLLGESENFQAARERIFQFDFSSSSREEWELHWIEQVGKMYLLGKQEEDELTGAETAALADWITDTSLALCQVWQVQKTMEVEG